MKAISELPDRVYEKIQFGPYSNGWRLPASPLNCWLWTAHIDKKGYGQVRWEGKAVLAHRLTYTLLIGTIPEGLELDHLCRVTNCVNPEHLEPVTHAENVRRGGAGKHESAKTQCPQGHPYDEANTYHRPDGARRCRECGRTWDRAYRLKKKNIPPLMFWMPTYTLSYTKRTVLNEQS